MSLLTSLNAPNNVMLFQATSQKLWTWSTLSETALVSPSQYVAYQTKKHGLGVDIIR